MKVLEAGYGESGPETLGTFYLMEFRTTIELPVEITAQRIAKALRLDDVKYAAEDVAVWDLQLHNCNVVLRGFGDGKPEFVLAFEAVEAAVAYRFKMPPHRPLKIEVEGAPKIMALVRGALKYRIRTGGVA